MFRNRSWLWWIIAIAVVYFVWRKFGAQIMATISKVTT